MGERLAFGNIMARFIVYRNDSCTFWGLDFL